MPLDYRLAMAAPQERFGTLKDIMAIGQLHDQDRQQQQARIDAAQEQQARQVMQQVFQQHADDPEQGIVELRRRGFLKQADELDKQLQGHRKALLENRKLDLEAQRLTGQIDGDAAEREIKAMAANSPEKILELYAGVTNPEEAEAAKGLMRFRFGAKAEPVIAMLGDYSPDKAAFAGRTAMGPAKVADIANQNTDNERAAAQVAATEAARADTNARMSAASAEAARHNKVMEGQGAQRIGQAGAGGAVSTPATQALARTVFNNPALYGRMTDTNKDKIAVDLEKLGFDFAKYGGQAPADNKPPTGVERRTGGFFNRAKQADEDLANVEEGIAQSSTPAQYWREYMPNFLQTTQGQQYTAAQRAFTEARLRKDSGAAIPEQEFKNDRQTYFVQAGDDAATVKQKQRARAAILASMASESGRALREFYGDEADSLVAGYRERSKQPSKDKPGEVQQVGNKFRVTGKDGVPYDFPTKAAAEQFKRDGG